MSQPPSAPCCLAPVSLAPDSRPRTWAQHCCADADWHVSQPRGWSTRGSLSSPGLCFLTSETTVMALTPPPSWGCCVGLIAEPREDSEWAAGPARPWGRPSLYTAHSPLAPLLPGPSAQRGSERGAGQAVKVMEASPTATTARGGFWRARSHAFLREEGLVCCEASPQRPESDHRQEGLAGLQRLLALNAMGRLQWWAPNPGTPMHPRACISEPYKRTLKLGLPTAVPTPTSTLRPAT